ncbi:MAG: hypothetical protein ACR5LA_05710 [Wolbachia sp.]
MLYSKEDIRELCLDADRFLMDDNRHNSKVTSLEDLQNRLRRKAKFREIDLQSKCKGDNSLGDLLLKNADENNDLRVREFFLKNGFKLPEQEQVTADENKEKEEQNTPNVEEDRAELSNKNEDDQFSTSYNKIKKIVASNPNITAEKFCNELKKEKIDIKITNQDGWTLLYYAVRSEGPGIIDDRIIFLKIVELLTNLNIGIDFKDTASKTVLGTAAINKLIL